MILKLGQQESKKWFFYDRIKQVRTYIGLRSLEEPINDDEMNLLSESRNPQYPISVCEVRFEDNSSKTFYFEVGYLLNNEGKTIERL